MNFARITVLVLLGLTGLMQCLEGLASIVNPAGMMAGLSLTMAPDDEVPLTFLGLAMIVRAAVTAIAFGWMIQRKPEGLFLARFTALTILLSAPVVYLKLHRIDLAAGDLVQGVLLLLPALVYKDQPSRGSL
jgi:spore maturation protein SpmA